MEALSHFHTYECAGPRSITANKLKCLRPRRPAERKAEKDAEDGGGGVHVSMNFRECIRKAEFTDMDGKAQITTAY